MKVKATDIMVLNLNLYHPGNEVVIYIPLVFFKYELCTAR